MAGRVGWISTPDVKVVALVKAWTHQGQLQKEGSSGPPGTSHPGCCSIDSPSRLRLAQSPVLRAALTPGNSRSRRQEGEDL